MNDTSDVSSLQHTNPHQGPHLVTTPVPGAIVQQWLRGKPQNLTLPSPHQSVIWPGVQLTLNIQRAHMAGCPAELKNHAYFQKDSVLEYYFFLLNPGPGQAGIWYPMQDHVHAEFGAWHIVRPFPNKGTGLGVTTDFIADHSGIYTFGVGFQVNGDQSTRSAVQNCSYSIQLRGRFK